MLGQTCPENGPIPWASDELGALFWSPRQKTAQGRRLVSIRRQMFVSVLSEDFRSSTRPVFEKQENGRVGGPGFVPLSFWLVYAFGHKLTDLEGTHAQAPSPLALNS